MYNDCLTVRLLIRELAFQPEVIGVPVKINMDFDRSKIATLDVPDLASKQEMKQPNYGTNTER